MSENIVSFKPRPKLLSGQRLRAYSPEMARGTARCVAMLEACSTLQKMLRDAEGRDTALLPDTTAWQEDPVDAALNRIRNEVLQRLIEHLDLAGLEYRDECGEVIDAIQGVSDPTEGSYLSSWVHMERCGGVELDSFCEAMRYGCGCFFALPGSKALYDAAILEAARARLGEAAP
jgi:hypothetical protein